MDFQDLGVREVNAYYARQGGIRTAAVNGYANVASFPALMQRAAMQAARARETAQTQAAAQAGKASLTGAAAQSRTAMQYRKANQADATVQAGKAAQSQKAAQIGKTARTDGEVQTDQSSNGNASAQSISHNGSICCDKCQAVSQVVLQMMSKNLYAQSALGYPLAGGSSWTAYQNMANILGGSLF